MLSGWLSSADNALFTRLLSKHLSNQKYRDLRKQYGNEAVGLVTGDIVEHSHAAIVIMTTEVYRNMLLEDGGEHIDRRRNVQRQSHCRI